MVPGRGKARMTQSKLIQSTRAQESKAPSECRHQALAKVESKISKADTDVQIYVCTTCGKSFMVNDW
jgi:transposase-like protein